ncbi:flavin reductase family protein [Schwartzia sp. (in: firmicutes)]
MDNKALYKLSYGVFMLASRDGDVKNGCITNTCMQVASNPARIAISSITTNYTCELIKKSGLFTLSMLDNSVKFDTIKNFGFQSGRDIDKFKYLSVPVDANGIPYLDKEVCAVLSGKVVYGKDLGSHMLFVAEVTDAKILSQNPPLTYADYQAHVKPKPEAKKDDRKIIAWRCRICGYVHESPELPADFSCPLCGHSADDFEPVYAD